MSQKNKRRGKNTKSKIEGQKRDIIFAEDDQMYATVEKMLGNCRVQAKCTDGKSRMCHIRGKMKKRVWIKEGSTILVGLRDFEEDKADVIHCYMPDEVRRLESYGEIASAGNLEENNTENNILWEDEGFDEELIEKTNNIKTESKKEVSNNKQNEPNLSIFDNNDQNNDYDIDKEVDIL